MPDYTAEVGLTLSAESPEKAIEVMEAIGEALIGEELVMTVRTPGVDEIVAGEMAVPTDDDPQEISASADTNDADAESVGDETDGSDG